MPIYYSQTDPRWANFMYGTATMAKSGCGATSAAMVISSLTDKTVTPKEMAEYSLSIGARIPNVGTNGYLLHPSVGKKYNLKCVQTQDISVAMECVKDGGMAVCSTPGGTKGLFSTGGHQFCLVGVNGATLEFFDPYMYSGKYNTKYRKNKATVKGNSVFVSKQNAKPEIVVFWCFYPSEDKGEEFNVDQTVMELPAKVYIQEINPIDFEIFVNNSKKKSVSKPNYFNAGFCTYLADGNAIPVGNLANDGKIISQAKDNADWINLAKHKLTTIYTTTNGECCITKTDSLDNIQNLKTAISGIPIIVGGKYVGIDAIKEEGYFGNEMYDTWHGFLGIRHDKLVYVAMECDYGQMCWALVALGIYNAIKLDGGGSFILKNGKVLRSTDENRKIHNVGIWK